MGDYDEHAALLPGAPVSAPGFDPQEEITLYCEKCGHRRIGLRLKAALLGFRLFCPAPKEPDGPGCGKETLHHTTRDPRACACQALLGRFAPPPAPGAAP
jgi:hypothetical protein